MTKSYFFPAVMLSWTTLFAQTQPPGALSYQPAQTLSIPRAGRGGAAVMPLPRQERGRPFSATITTETVQTFVDGTHIIQKTTMLAWRDMDGRVRTETVRPSGESAGILIRDPVAGVDYRLDPINKRANRVNGATVFGGQQTGPAQPAGRGQIAGGVQAGGSGQSGVPAPAIRLAATRGMSSDRAEEDLGTTTINGVSAHGTRTTTIVPAGAIGNDRDFRITDERWFSPELDMLVKSVSSDPRFGSTTYELTGINRQPPDASLFQVPADYTLVPITLVPNVGRGR